MRQKISRRARRSQAKKKVLVAGYDQLSTKEKKDANGVIRTLRKGGYNVEKV